MKTLLIIPILMSKLMGDAPHALGILALNHTGGSGIAGAMSLNWGISKKKTTQACSSTVLLTQSLSQPAVMQRSSLPFTRLSSAAKLI